jgi:hypothetical protein
VFKLWNLAIPVFASRNSFEKIKAILLSGTATVWGAADVGAGVAGFCCADTQKAAIVSKAAAAKKRAIFMTFLYYSLS